MTDISLDARVTELEENGGGSGSNGTHVLQSNVIKQNIFRFGKAACTIDFKIRN